MSEDGALFDMAPVATPIPPGLSPGQRRTARQRQLLQRGVHPLSGSQAYSQIRLHPEAAPVDDADAEGRRCGNCRFRELALHHDYRYPKCFWTGSLGPEELHKHGHPRVTHGEATDVRAWWPACTDHEYGDPQLSSDAFRSGPLPPTPPVV